MSRVFNDKTNFSGLAQKYEEEIGVEEGFITDNTKRLKKFASATRSAWDTYVYLALKASGKWQYDDSNHSKFPIVYADLVSGQQDYTFTTDEEGSLILDIYKVMILSENGTLYEEIYPIDQQAIGQNDDISQENTAGGTPFRYDKTANGIFLTPIPDYAKTKGLKVLINREASYFTSTDTTKMPGCPGIHHDYFFLKPALEEARKNNLKNYDRLREEVVSFEGDEEKGVTGSIERYFSRRKRDERNIMTPRITKFI